MRVVEIEMAVEALRDDDLAKFAEWFADYHWHRRDQQIERDLENGKLDSIINEAEAEYDAGLATPL
jgi:hypothetical protein